MKHIFTLIALLILLYLLCCWATSAPWCRFWVGGIHFWKLGQTVTVTGASYRDMTTVLSCDIGWYWCGQYVVSTWRCHMPYSQWNNSCMGHFLAMYSIVLVIRIGSLDHVGLTPTTIHALKEEIKCCINEICLQLCRKVMTNFDRRIEVICPMCYTINNPSVCTLWFNEKIIIFRIINVFSI